MEWIALILTLILGLFIIIGTIIGLKTKNSEKFVSFSISLAFGVMIGLSFLELLPEAIEHLEKSYFILIIFTIIGIIILKFLHHFIPHHAHDEGKKHSQKEHREHLNHIGIISSIALILHNIIEGMAIFGTTTNSISAGILVGIGVGLHNIPMGIIIGSTLENKHPIIMSFLISISTFLGGLIMFLLGGWINQDFILGILLSITLGMILYIALAELLEQIINTKNKKETIYGLILGILILIISTQIGHHH